MEKDSLVNWLKPKNDFVFKLIFGSDNETSKELLIAFLNDVLNVPEGQSLVAVEILNPIVDKESIADKLAILDIKARVIGYGYINIELQLLNQKNIHKRSLYYCSKVYEEQLGEGDDYKKLSRVVAINLIDFPFFTTDNYRSCFRFMEENEGEPYPDLMQLHFFELTKFIEQDNEYDVDVNDRMVKWLRFITNSDDTRWEAMAKNEPIINKAVEKLRLASLDPEARMKYEAREKALKDMASIRGDGIREGRIEGRIEGKEEGKLEVAKKLLEKGMDLEEVQSLTGFPYSKLKELQEG